MCGARDQCACRHSLQTGGVIGFSLFRVTGPQMTQASRTRLVQKGDSPHNIVGPDSQNPTRLRIPCTTRPQAFLTLSHYSDSIGNVACSKAVKPQHAFVIKGLAPNMKKDVLYILTLACVTTPTKGHS